jgi:hypothetical protein
MSGILALSTAATVALIAGILAGLAFIGGFIALAARRRPPVAPDIPPGMQPGPPDEVLERRHLERVIAWGIPFTLIFAVAVAVVWLREPAQNVADAEELMARSVARGERWFEVASDENPLGFGCERCHGEKGVGGLEIPFTPPGGEPTFVQPPPLNDVCTRLTIEGTGQIRETIMQGREGTPMPSWSVRFAGPMNDQQIQDLINLIVELNEENPNVDPKSNLCLNPPTGEAEQAGEEPAEEEGVETGGGEPAGADASPSPEGTPAEEATPGGS